MWTREFWLSALERAFKTFCQTLVAVLTAGDQVAGILPLNWREALGFSVYTGVLSILSSVGSHPFNGFSGPSLAKEKIPDKDS